MRKIKVGIIGCGHISHIYFKTLKNSPVIDIVACADLDINRAKERAKTYEINKVLSVDEFFLDSEIELIVNLTIPSVHAEIHLKALTSGKHTYGEKPLATDIKSGKPILQLAKEKGLLVGSAPDTFLGGGIQTCRKLIDDGAIGKPIAATAFMMSHGPESFHPNPQFLYQKGAGPLLDMGPYYLTALITLIGSIRRVTGTASTAFTERTITTEKNYGETFPVETPTHVASLLDFENGAVGSLITSFDVWGSNTPNIEIYGTEGSLVVPDPNRFGGEVYVKRKDETNFSQVPITSGYIENRRGLGVIDMAYAIRNGSKHRATGEMAFHVLEVMEKILQASEMGMHHEIESRCLKPEPFPVDGLKEFIK